MNIPDRELTRHVVIVNELGLHARAAAKIAALAQNAASKLWIIKDGEKADASGIIDILTLACQKGSAITLSAESASDRHILDAIANLVESGFEE